MQETDFLKALEGKNIPILTLDHNWHRLFGQSRMTPRIKDLEEEVNDLLKEQGRINTEMRKLTALKKDLMDKILKKTEEGRPFFVNCYPRVVTEEGSASGREIIRSTMEPVDAEWRGLGIIPSSGLALRGEFEDWDARKKFDLPEIKGHGNPACRCGEVLQGKCRPDQCPVFGRACTPEHPVGACMVSGEGACSAYYKYDFNRR